MGIHKPISEQPYKAGDANATPWAEASRLLAEADTYWLGTTRPDGRPHVVPVLGVSAGGAVCFAASPHSRKAQHLARDPYCVLTTHAEGLDLVLEGRVMKLRDEAKLHWVAELYASKYGWPVTIRDGAFWGEGAPTAGPPPYEIYKLLPSAAFGFPTTDGGLTPTRWRFEAAAH
jgi:Pyridoxamine 5'-phosphate oxidase